MFTVIIYIYTLDDLILDPDLLPILFYKMFPSFH